MSPYMRKALLLCIILCVYICYIVSAEPNITVKPLYFLPHEREITSTWTGITTPTSGDVIVLYSIPNTSEVPYKGPKDEKKVIGFHKVYEFDIQLIGSGKATFPIYPSRNRGFYIEYQRVNDKTTELIAYTDISRMDGSTAPHQFHLAHTHNDTEMLIQFTSLAKDAKFKCQVSTTPFTTTTTHDSADNIQLYDSIITGTYTFDQMVDKPANIKELWIDPGYFYECLVTSLAYETHYYYRIVEGDKPVSITYDFVSSGQVGHSAANVYLFGDSGVGFPFYTQIEQQEMSVLTMKNIYNNIQSIRSKGDYTTPISLLHFGDISYARGYMYLWEYFFSQIEPVASHIPYMITIGNHEYDYMTQPWKPQWSDYGNDSGGEAGIPTFRRFRMPNDFQYTPYTDDTYIVDQETKDYKERSERNLAYSYNVGTVHFIIFSSEHNFTEDSAQYNFILQDLIHVDRVLTPWVILVAHRPTYCSTMGCSIAKDSTENKMDLRIRNVYEPLMIKYRVNIGIFGHNHHYERTCPMKESYVCLDQIQLANGQHIPVFEITPQGTEIIRSVAPIHIVSGAAGNSYEPGWAPYSPHVTTGPGQLHHYQPDHVIFRTQNFGYTHLYADNVKLTFTYYSNVRNTIHDQFTLIDPY